jgi:hypothetical protein
MAHVRIRVEIFRSGRLGAHTSLFFLFSSSLLLNNKYTEVEASDQAESRAAGKGCHDREAIFAEGRGLPSSDDVSGGRAAPVHEQALGRFLSIFPSRQRDMSGTLAPIGSGTSAEQASGLAATNNFKNNSHPGGSHAYRAINRACSEMIDAPI